MAKTGKTNRRIRKTGLEELDLLLEASGSKKTGVNKKTKKVIAINRLTGRIVYQANSVKEMAVKTGMRPGTIYLRILRHDWTNREILRFKYVEEFEVGPHAEDPSFS